MTEKDLNSLVKGGSTAYDNSKTVLACIALAGLLILIGVLTQ